MHLYTTTTEALVLILAHQTNAHVKMDYPVPYGTASLNTEPLLSTGADWPCKQRPGGYDIKMWNIMPIGSSQNLRFQGQATHGGGSCQIALTKDTPPTAQSVFKVIKSIEGGCPSTNPGNVGTDPFGYGADEFHFDIPDVIPPANYTLAWTWFNKIGNREMYMNCAPVTVIPASPSKHRRHRADFQKRADGMDALPNLFRANSGNGCSTAPSGTVVAIPAENLGKDVQRIGSEPLTPPVGSCGGAGATPGDKVSNDIQATEAESIRGLSSSVQPSPAPASTAVPVLKAVKASTLNAASAIPSAHPAKSVSQPTDASAGAGGSTGSCPTPGKSVCSEDGKAWGTCMENHQVVYQPVAVGTKCDPSLGVEVVARLA